MSIPEFDGIEKYWLGFDLRYLASNLEWFKQNAAGIIRLKNNKLLSREEVSYIAWMKGHPPTEWQAQGMLPNPPDKRTLNVEMQEWTLLSAQQRALININKQKLPAGMTGRKIYFILWVPKFRICSAKPINNGHYKLKLARGILSRNIRMSWRNWFLCNLDSIHYTNKLSTNNLIETSIDTTGSHLQLRSNDGQIKLSTFDINLHSRALDRIPWQIVYIGLSKNLSTRINNHEKLILALSLCPEDYECAILACDFTESIFVQAKPLPDILEVLNQHPRNITERIRLRVIETMLIWYFQPFLNYDDVKRPGWEGPKLKTAMKSAHITHLSLRFAPLESNLPLISEKVPKINHDLKLTYRINDDAIKAEEYLGEFDLTSNNYANTP